MAAEGGRTVRTVATGAVGLCLLVGLTAGCGVRVDSALRQRAANAQLGIGSGGIGLGSGSGQYASGADGGGLLSGSSADAGGSGSAAGAASAAGGGSTDAGIAGASGAPTVGGAAPAGGNGGATDVGVTANSILLGNVSDLSGPVPGLFQGAVTGTLAYFNYVNSQGGVFGRQLKLASADSQTSCSQTESAYSSLIPKVFGFVGSFNLYDDCGANVEGQHTDIPLAEFKLTQQGLSLPNDFDVGPLPPGGYPTGMFSYYGGKFGSSAVQNTGTLYANIPSSVAQAQGQMNAAQSVGWKFTYTRAIGATESNFTTDVVRMQQQGIKVVYLGALTAQDIAIFVDEANQQNWHPLYVVPVAYAQNFVQLAGGASAVEGMFGFTLYSLFFNPTDAQNIPEVALYQQWMQKTSSSQPEDLYSMYGWAEAALFVQALKAAGPHVTRAAVMSALKSVHNFSDNGVVGPADPADKGPTHCYVLWQIHSGQFVRTDTPANNFRCDGTFFKG